VKVEGRILQSYKSEGGFYHKEMLVSVGEGDIDGLHARRAQAATAPFFAFDFSAEMEDPCVVPLNNNVNSQLLCIKNPFHCSSHWHLPFPLTLLYCKPPTKSPKTTKLSKNSKKSGPMPL
jgi:hypothetical protein